MNTEIKTKFNCRVVVKGSRILNTYMNMTLFVDVTTGAKETINKENLQPHFKSTILSVSQIADGTCWTPQKTIEL